MLRTRNRRAGAVAIGAGLLVLTLALGTAPATATTEPPADAPPPAPSPSTAPAADETAPAPAATETAPSSAAAEPEAATTEPTATSTPETADTDPTALRAAAGNPSVTVSPTTGLNPAGGSTITVNGTGFDPDANNGFGVYAAFGPADPGTYFEDANRFLAAMWMHPGGGSAGSPGQGELNADGSFTATLPPAGGLPLTAQYTDGNGQPVNCLTTQCYVITMAAHGVDDRSQDTCTAVSFAGGTAVPTLDAQCQPVATPTGTPTGNGNPTGGNGTTTGGNQSNSGSNGTSGSRSSSTLPRTGSTTTPLVVLGTVLVVGGLVLGRSNSRQRPVPLRVDRRT
jgi:LPXTG-motif cell wall-anchored protein